MIGNVTFEHTTFAELPFKFEAGTPDFVGISALRTAIDYINGIGMERIAAHEKELLEYTTARMMEIPGMRIFVRTGHHCAEPLMHRLGIEGTVRASFALYNTKEECDAFITALRRVASMLL